jgi:hypothetical protein
MLATRYRIGKPLKERYHTYYTPMPKLTKYPVPLSWHRARVQYWTGERVKWLSLRKVFPNHYRVTDYYPKKVRIRRREKVLAIWVLRCIVRYPYTLRIKTRVKIVFYTLVAVTLCLTYGSSFYELWAEPLTNYVRHRPE